MSHDEFLKQPAADVAADVNFGRFVRALERGSQPGIPPRVIEEHFASAGNETVGQVLKSIFAQYPRTNDLDIIIEDIRRVGATEQDQVDYLEAELARLRPTLAAWYAFMDGSPRPDS